MPVTPLPGRCAVVQQCRAMNEAIRRMAGRASGVSRGSAWKTCTWSGHSCSSQAPPAARTSCGQCDGVGERASRRRRPGSASAATCRPAGHVELQPGVRRHRLPRNTTRRAERRRRTRIAGSRRSCSRVRASPNVRSSSGESNASAGGVGDVGLQQQVDGEVTARGVPRDEDAVAVPPPRLGHSQSHPARTSSAAVGNRCAGASR